MVSNRCSRWLLIPTAVVVMLCLFPALLLSSVWWNMAGLPLPGGRHGPLDAYRHTLASAFLSKTLGPSSVKFVTRLMENCEKRSCAMDRHNNAIGSRLGNESTSYADLPRRVLEQVSRGEVNSRDANRSTWLPEEDWKPGFFW